MIALDTSILIRYLAQDDAAQSPLATALIESRLNAETPGFISIVVLCETIQVLGALYGQTRQEIVLIIEKLIESAQLVIDDVDAVRSAIALPHVDVCDAIIHAIGRDRGCQQTLTFDRHFSSLPQVEYLTAWRAS